jgi:hypothetical protein
MQMATTEKKSVTFLPYWTFWLDMEKSGKKTNEQANLSKRRFLDFFDEVPLFE